MMRRFALLACGIAVVAIVGAGYALLPGIDVGVPGVAAVPQAPQAAAQPDQITACFICRAPRDNNPL
ncbi:MAG: hypothetical protein ACRDQZ_03225 [Mycobacteriales bacterium]